MKKSIYFLAMAVFAVFCAVSCGDDDDFVKPDNSNIVLPDPPLASQAAEYQFTGNGLKSTDEEATLKELTITEGGKAVFHVVTPEGDKYMTYDVMKDNGVIKIYDDLGNCIGEAQELGTKSSATVTLILDIEITVNGKSYTFQITGENALTVLKVANEVSGGQVLANLARTWDVQSLFLTLSGDVDLSKYEDSGNMEVFVNEARKRDVGLTAEEEAQLSKIIKSVTPDKNGNLFIEYIEKDGTYLTEAAKWEWIDSKMSGIVIKFRDTKMGNKFMSDNSQIAIEFNAAGGLTLALNTDIKGSKNYHANLIVVLK